MRLAQWLLALTFVSGALAASTPRHGLPFTSQEGLNQALSTIDSRLPLTPTGAPADAVILCGQLANNGTIYFSPVGGGDITGEVGEGGAASAGGTNCNAGDNATEATADYPIFTQFRARVLGMLCKAVDDAGATGSGANGVVFTLRSAAADLSPSLTCTVPTGQLECMARPATLATAPVIAAGATAAVKAVDTEDLSADDGWCKIWVSLEP